MNKLSVALKLLQLLNEYKRIDSKMVADELNVSRRTAQRYLTELSILPCVVSEHDNHTYSLNLDYQLNESLMRHSVAKAASHAANPAEREVAENFCKMCRSQLHCHCWFLSAHRGVTRISNLNRMNRLSVLISKRSKDKRPGI